jgi:hypothetical protein
VNSSTIKCRVCDQLCDESVSLSGWRAMWTNPTGTLTTTHELSDSQGLLENIRAGFWKTAELAFVCGQTHALILAERFLERGTFEPATSTSNTERTIAA